MTRPELGAHLEMKRGYGQLEYVHMYCTYMSL